MKLRVNNYDHRPQGACMSYKELKDEIESIASISNSVPEPFRDKCFELLLSHLLDSHTPKKEVTEKHEGKEKDEESAIKLITNGSATIPTPSQVKVFMQKTGVTMEDLKRVVIFEDDDVHFVQEPTTQKIARGQIEWALLLALRNGIVSNALSVDAESVRSICQDKGFYDKGNFSKNFKNNSTLFQAPLEPQGDAQKLSGEGQKELGKLIKELAGTS